ncbi:MAG: tripartite tricarboxylate transporter TctB family protein [Beijerinckiaceae bacterium]
MTLTKDSIAGFLLLAIAVGYYWLTRDIPSSSLSDEVGADGLPKVLAGGLAIVALLITGKGLLAARKPAAKITGDDSKPEHAPLPRALGFILIGIAYMVLAPLVGFAVGIAALITAIAVYEREALSLKLVMVALGGGVGFWLIFVRFLGSDQPASSLLALLMKS